MDTKASFDEEDNVPPYLPDTSVGSSVSSSMENEYNELLKNTLIVPLFEPEHIKVQRVLQNTMGLFSTVPLGDAGTGSKELNEETKLIKEEPKPEVESGKTEKIVGAQVDDPVVSNERKDSEASSATNTEIINCEDSIVGQQAKADEEQQKIEDPSPAANINEDIERINLPTKDPVELPVADEPEAILSETIRESEETKADENINTIQEDTNKTKEIEESPVQVTKMMVDRNNTTDDLLISNQTPGSCVTSEEGSSSSCQIENSDVNCNVSLPQQTNSECESSSSDSPSSVISKLQDEMMPIVRTLNNFSPASEELYTVMKRQLDITPLDSNSNDANPRKDSPVPASPPTNIEIDMNELSSMEHTLGNQNNNHSNQRTHSVVNMCPPKSVETESLNKQLFKASACEMSGRSKQAVSGTGAKVSGNLDKWLKELKGHILSEFERTRANICHEHQKKLQEERDKQLTEMCKLKRELDMSREKFKMSEINTLKKNEAIENLTKQLEKQREKAELQRVMMEWKFNKVETEREDFTSKLADKFYQQRLKMRAFVSWHCFMNQRHKLKLEKACKKKAEEVCYDMATKYEARLKKMDEELAKARAEIDGYRDEMAKNEDYMKKALMRGVCALNMEAMSIFNDTIGNKTNSQTSSLDNLIETAPSSHQMSQNPLQNQLATGADLCGKPSNKSYQVTYCPAYHKNDVASCESSSSASTSTSDSSLDGIHKGSHRSDKELARRVKSYCEKSLGSKTQAAAAQSAVSKAKWNLLKTNQSPGVQLQQQQQGPQYYQSQESTDSHAKPAMSHSSKIHSGCRVFEELSEHYLPLGVKTTPSIKPKAKSKINSLPTSVTTTTTKKSRDPVIVVTSPCYNSAAKINTVTSKSSSSSYSLSDRRGLPPQAQPPHRSVVIEKHTNFANEDNTNTCEVKYAPSTAKQQNTKLINTLHSNMHR